MRPLVRVTWIDAQDIRDTWIDAEKLEEKAEDDVTVYSVGYLVKVTNRYITIAADFSPNPDMYGRPTKIPMGMVQRIEELAGDHTSPQSIPIAVTESVPVEPKPPATVLPFPAAPDTSD